MGHIQLSTTSTNLPAENQHSQKCSELEAQNSELSMKLKKLRIKCQSYEAEMDKMKDEMKIMRALNEINNVEKDTLDMSIQTDPLPQKTNNVRETQRAKKLTSFKGYRNRPPAGYGSSTHRKSNYKSLKNSRHPPAKKQSKSDGSDRFSSGVSLDRRKKKKKPITNGNGRRGSRDKVRSSSNARAPKPKKNGVAKIKDISVREFSEKDHRPTPRFRNLSNQASFSNQEKSESANSLNIFKTHVSYNSEPQGNRDSSGRLVVIKHKILNQRRFTGGMLDLEGIKNQRNNYKAKNSIKKMLEERRSKNIKNKQKSPKEQFSSSLRDKKKRDEVVGSKRWTIGKKRKKGELDSMLRFQKQKYSSSSAKFHSSAKAIANSYSKNKLGRGHKEAYSSENIAGEGDWMKFNIYDKKNKNFIKK